MRPLRLSDGQTLRVYGLLPPTSMLDWDTVVRRSLRFRWLHETLRLTPRQLHTLQPDAAAWAAAGLVGLEDCTHMTAWPLNPLVHLGIPADRLVGHTAASLAQYGVTFAQMRQAGLSFHMMQLFHFSLREWQALGFAHTDAQQLPDSMARLMFGMSAHDTVHACTTGVAWVVEMMRFVEEKSAVMHIDVIATEIALSLQDAHPDQADVLTEDYIKEHLARHVVTPVASITRITRDLLDMCETLRPSAATLSQRRRRAVEDSGGSNKRARKRGGDDDVESVPDDSSDTRAPVEEEIGMYLRAVGQVMQIYRLHSRILQAPT